MKLFWLLAVFLGLASGQTYSISSYWTSSTTCGGNPNVITAITLPCLNLTCSGLNTLGTTTYCSNTFSTPVGTTYAVYSTGGSTTCANPTSITAVEATGDCISIPAVVQFYYKATCQGNSASYYQCNDAACSDCTIGTSKHGCDSDLGISLTCSDAAKVSAYLFLAFLLSAFVVALTM